MATSVSSVVSHFPEAENGFTTTTAGSVSSGATTVTLNSVAGYTNGEPVVLVIDPTDASKKQTFTGIVDTGGVQITSVVWTAGTNQTHALGATVVDYATATHISMISKGIKVHADQDGTLKAGAVDVTAVIADGVITKAKLATAEKSALDSGWSPKYGDTTMPAPNTVTCNGNRSYDVVFNSVDLTGYLSAGMRIRTTRTVAAPTQCTDLEAGSSQYYSKSSPSGMTFTDDFVVSAWVKLESYAAMTIASRWNGTSGWVLDLNSSGQLQLVGFNGGAGNNSYVLSYQSVPLGRWVHVAAQLDMSTFTATSTTSYVMIDGVDVPASVVRGGTNPTALVQAGNLEIGSRNGGTNFFDGKIAQVAIYSAKVTQANVLATISQGLSGSETSLISAYSFNNSINDLNANANNLTAQNSAVATATDSPFGGQADGTISSTLDYAIITKTAFSTNTTLTVQVPEGCTIPTSGGVSAVSYSTQKIPYLMPTQADKWEVSCLLKIDVTQASPSASTWYNPYSSQLAVPIGSWSLGYLGPLFASKNTTTTLRTRATLSTGSSSESDKEYTSLVQVDGASANLAISSSVNVEKLVSVSSSTPYYLNVQTDYSSVGTIGFLAAVYSIPTRIVAKCAYL